MLVALALILCQPPAARDFTPVLLPDGADPWLARGDDGTYYLLVTTARDVTIRRAKSLTGLAAGASKTVWTPPADGPTSKNLWAPELHRLGGKWYVYFAADDGDNKNHRLYVLENPDPDPYAGRFTLKGKLADPAADRWAIDGTVFTARGKQYLAWSGWDGDADGQQNLYLAPLANPWTLAGPRVEISRPTHAWETVDDPDVNEGPQALVRNGTVHLVYSASGSWTDDYCLGRLTLKADVDPLDPKAWTKHPEPVFKSGNGVFGPGHSSFVNSPDGKEDWLVYHAARHKGAGWSRNIRMQKFEWGKDDTPRFGEPASADKLIPLPAGDPVRQRYAVKADAEFAVEVKEAGTHTLTVRYANDSAKKTTASHTLTVNGTASAIEYVYTAGNWAAATVRVELKAGANTVRLTAGKSGVVIDGVDVAAEK